MSLLIGLSLAALTFWLADMPLSPRRLLVLGVVKAWPLVPALGLLWRWSRRQVLAVLLAWMTVAGLVVIWQSNEQQTPAMVLTFLSMEALPLVWVLLICMGGATRAISPWLLLPLFGLCVASVVSVDGMAWLVDRRASVLFVLLDSVGVVGVFAIAIFLPWLLLAWPVVWLMRRVAKAYEDQHLSDLMSLFTVLWALSACAAALGQTAASTLGQGLLLTLPLLWIPLVLMTTRRWVPVPHDGRAPTLLVLRVFQRDAAVQALFDQVVERWRLVGPVVMIAGTDLLDRTIDLADLVTFVAGRLRQRMVHRVDDVPARLSEFRWMPDADGRWRVNEVLCGDSSWQVALDGLMAQSDVVLMDLRDFQASNHGCRHELRVLSRAQAVQRVVVLVNDRTDRPCADAETASAPAGRFHWCEVGGAKPASLRRLTLAALLGQPGDAGRAPRLAEARARC